MYKHPATAIKPLLNETVGCWEVLQQVFVFDVVDVDYMMLVGAEQILVEWHAQHGQDVGDAGVLESVTPA